MVVCKGGFLWKNCHYRWRDHWYDLASYLDTSKFNVALFDEGQDRQLKLALGLSPLVVETQKQTMVSSG